MIRQAISKRPRETLAYGLFMAIVCFYGAAAIWFPMVYIWATYEDLFGEWIQFWALIVALAVSVRLFAAQWPFRWFFLLLAGSCFYVAMEEISWGQRLLGFSSPEFFRANNLQGETNLHNFLTGPYSTALKEWITYAVAIALGLFGLVYPAALRFRWRPALWLEARGVAAPPLYLWPYFVGAAVLEWGPFHFNEAEVAEILVGLALAFMTVQYLADRLSTGRALVPASVGRRGSARLAIRQAGAMLLVIVLAGGTTAAVYASPRGRARIEGRIGAGIKKFAGRYARYEQWETSAELYGRTLAAKPRSVSTLRKLAECYEEMGDRRNFDRYISKAIAIDLQRLAKKPDSASANRSLVRDYRMTGQQAKAKRHLHEALRIGLERINKKPASPAAAYSLGKTYSLMGMYGAALAQFSKAYDLKPTSKKYRKAYYSAKKMVN